MQQAPRHPLSVGLLRDAVIADGIHLRPQVDPDFIIPVRLCEFLAVVLEAVVEPTVEFGSVDGSGIRVEQWTAPAPMATTKSERGRHRPPYFGLQSPNICSRR